MSSKYRLLRLAVPTRLLFQKQIIHSIPRADQKRDTRLKASSVDNVIITEAAQRSCSSSDHSVLQLSADTIYIHQTTVMILHNSAKNSDHMMLDNAMMYVAGYVANKIVTLHKCEKCFAAFCTDGDLLDCRSVFIHLKAFCVGDFGRLKVPNDKLVSLYNLLKSGYT